eukprot:TRINITY_DN61382_c0_g1_i1.p1 TRINITY_DN61382_c0_g1~~TRINITY_DN61382_c0_g1_i1.p1  ORF type:complete len:529 (-),score=132.91 TRINITY_DN61382_c0_g1_i1:136-1722(-)
MGCGASAARYARGAWDDGDGYWSDSVSEDEGEDDDVATPKKPRQDGRWLWEESPDIWQAFDDKTNGKLLDALQFGEKKLVYTLSTGGIYEVDFESKVQTHLETGTQRRIRFKAAKGGEVATDAEKSKDIPRKPPAAAKAAGYSEALGEWQWQAGPGKWQRFEPEVARILSVAKMLNKNRVVFGVKGKLYEGNLEELVQKNLSTGYQRRIRWQPSRQYQWEMKNGIWIDYEEEDNDILVAAFTKGKKSIRFSARGSEYEVDFEKMTQVNISANVAKPRRIRIAGLNGYAPGVPLGSMNADVSFPGQGPKAEPRRRPAPAGKPAGDEESATAKARRGEDPARPPFASFFFKHADAAKADAAKAARPQAKKAETGPPMKSKRFGFGGAAAGHAQPKKPKMPGMSSWKPPPGFRKGDAKVPGDTPPGRGGVPGGAPGGAPGAGPSAVPPPKAGDKPQLPGGVTLPESPKAQKAARQLFSELEVIKGKSVSERKKAFRNFCLKWHPDKNLDDEDTATEVFKFLQDLKDWLLDD